MVQYENRCCGCAAPGYPCRGSSCSLRHVEVHYCDRCDAEIEDVKIGEADGAELCGECFEELYETEE